MGVWLLPLVRSIPCYCSVYKRFIRLGFKSQMFSVVKLKETKYYK